MLKGKQKFIGNFNNHGIIHSFRFATPSTEGREYHRHWKDTGEKGVSFQVQICSPSSRCLFYSYFALFTLMLSVLCRSSMPLQKAFALETRRQCLCSTPSILNPGKAKRTGIASQLHPSCTFILAARVNNRKLNLAVQQRKVYDSDSLYLIS